MFRHDSSPWLNITLWGDARNAGLKTTVSHLQSANYIGEEERRKRGGGEEEERRGREEWSVGNPPGGGRGYQG